MTVPRLWEENPDAARYFFLLLVAEGRVPFVSGRPDGPPHPGTLGGVPGVFAPHGYAGGLRRFLLTRLGAVLPPDD